MYTFTHPPTNTIYKSAPSTNTYTSTHTRATPPTTTTTARLQWVYNILEGKQEADRVIFRDDDFLLLPDLKWSGDQIEDLYVMALVVKRDIGSLRDLNGSHLPLLRDILYKGTVGIGRPVFICLFRI